MNQMRDFLVRAATVVVAVGSLAGACQGQEVDGFTPLFNGRDLDGWYAIKTMDPRGFNALPEAERQQMIADAKRTTGEH